MSIELICFWDIFNGSNLKNPSEIFYQRENVHSYIFYGVDGIMYYMIEF